MTAYTGNISDNMLDNILGNIPDFILGNIPDIILGNIPDIILGNIPDNICVNHLLLVDYIISFSLLQEVLRGFLLF